MDIGAGKTCRRLGAADIGALRAALERVDDEVWLRNTMRQQRYRVHQSTQSIVFAWTENDWRRGSTMPTQRYDVDDALDAAAWGIARQVIERVGGGHVSKLMLAKLLAGGNVLPHRDTGDCLRLVHRVHVPVTTNPAVKFTVGGARIRMASGSIVEINNCLVHAVDNPSEKDRIHLICDVLPPGLQ